MIFTLRAWKYIIIMYRRENDKFKEDKTMKKVLALILAVVMCIGVFASCTGNNGDDTTTDAKGRVYWLNFKPESDATLQEVAKMYTDKTGIEVKVVTAASGSYNQLTSRILLSLKSSTPTHTICMTRTASSFPSVTAMSATASS